jgi:hypothetical protein
MFRGSKEKRKTEEERWKATDSGVPEYARTEVLTASVGRATG